MAKYARGKKSQAISDRSGLRVPYTQLKTTWDGLRVSPEDWEPKQPQLTPAKNVVDATALFNPRPDTDPENVKIFIGFNYDPFLDPRQRPSIGVHGKSNVGFIGITSTNTTQTGVAGTANVGNESLFVESQINVTGAAGTGSVAGTVPVELNAISTGVGGTGAIGSEALIGSPTATGAGGTGAVGNESVQILGWGNAGWGEDGWGE